jgi:hypothetical protein
LIGSGTDTSKLQVNPVQTLKKLSFQTEANSIVPFVVTPYRFQMDELPVSVITLEQDEFEPFMELITIPPVPGTPATGDEPEVEGRPPMSQLMFHTDTEINGTFRANGDLAVEASIGGSTYGISTFSGMEIIPGEDEEEDEEIPHSGVNLTAETINLSGDVLVNGAPVLTEISVGDSLTGDGLTTALNVNPIQTLVELFFQTPDGSEAPFRIMQSEEEISETLTQSSLRIGQAGEEPFMQFMSLPPTETNDPIRAIGIRAGVGVQDGDFALHKYNMAVDCTATRTLVPAQGGGKDQIVLNSHINLEANNITLDGAINLNGYGLFGGETDADPEPIRLESPVLIKPSLAIRTQDGAMIASFGNGENQNEIAFLGNVTVNGSAIGSGEIPTNPVFETVTAQNLILSGNVLHPLPAETYLADFSVGNAYVRCDINEPLTYVDCFILIRGLMTSAFKPEQAGAYSPSYAIPDEMKTWLKYSNFTIHTSEHNFQIDFSGTGPSDQEAWAAKVETDFLPLIGIYTGEDEPDSGSSGPSDVITMTDPTNGNSAVMTWVGDQDMGKKWELTFDNDPVLSVETIDGYPKLKCKHAIITDGTLRLGDFLFEAYEGSNVLSIGDMGGNNFLTLTKYAGGTANLHLNGTITASNFPT